MDITVKLRATVALGDASNSPLRNVNAVAEGLGLTLRQVHPGVPDPELSSYYVANAGSDREAADGAAARLAELDAVEAAYVSPDAEPPENHTITSLG